MDHYSLVFENSRGKIREIAAIEKNGQVKKEMFSQIHKFCTERGFEIPYVRMWYSQGKIVIDVGSHTEFFYLIL